MPATNLNAIAAARVILSHGHSRRSPLHPRPLALSALIRRKAVQLLSRTYRAAARAPKRTLLEAPRTRFSVPAKRIRGGHARHREHVPNLQKKTKIKLGGARNGHHKYHSGLPHERPREGLKQSSIFIAKRPRSGSRSTGLPSLRQSSPLIRRARLHSSRIKTQEKTAQKLAVSFRPRRSRQLTATARPQRSRALAAPIFFRIMHSKERRHGLRRAIMERQKCRRWEIIARNDVKEIGARWPEQTRSRRKVPSSRCSVYSATGRCKCR